MVRVYKRTTTDNYTKEELNSAVVEITRAVRPFSLGDAEHKYGIPKTTLQRHVKLKEAGIVQSKKRGGQTLFTEEEESILVDHIVVIGEFGQPIDLEGIRHVAQSYLNKRGRKVVALEDNLPSLDWARGLVNRHKHRLTNVIGRNIKWARAAISPDVIEAYIGELEKSLDGVAPEHILNFDETNFTDNPGDKKGLYRRGIKYPTRICNFTKSSTSVMFAGTIEKLLPCYIVYKAKGIFDEWTKGGPAGTFYNRSLSGWFDAECFRDWFFRVVVPWAMKIVGPKAMLGDNLSTHMDQEVIAKCIELNIRFICLIPNSTHLTQPLDVAIFGPIKRQWKNSLRNWKQTQRKTATTLPKQKFPRLLKTCLDSCEDTIEDNLQSGFRTCGIVPVSKEPLLAKLPKHAVETTVMSSQISEAFVEFLTPAEEETAPKKRQKAVPVEPGKAVTEEEAMKLLENKNKTKQARKPRQKKSARHLEGGSDSAVQATSSLEGGSDSTVQATSSHEGGSDSAVQATSSHEGGSDSAVHATSSLQGEKGRISSRGGVGSKLAVRGKENMTLDMYLESKKTQKKIFFEHKKVNIYKKKPKEKINSSKVMPGKNPSLTAASQLPSLQPSHPSPIHSPVSRGPTCTPSSSGKTTPQPPANQAIQSPRPTATPTAPGSVTRKPLGATRKRLGATGKPLGATRKPLGATRKPLGATRKRLGATRKPLGAKTVLTEVSGESNSESGASSDEGSTQTSDTEHFSFESFSFESFSQFLQLSPISKVGKNDIVDQAFIDHSGDKDNKKCEEGSSAKRKATSDNNALNTKRKRKELSASDTDSDFGDVDITASAKTVRENWCSISKNDD